MLIRFNITQALIDAASRDCFGCPVALAVAAELSSANHVAVWHDRVCVNSYPHRLPSYMRLWVEAFDRGECVEPIQFELEVMDKALAPESVYAEAA